MELQDICLGIAILIVVSGVAYSEFVEPAKILPSTFATSGSSDVVVNITAVAAPAAVAAVEAAAGSSEAPGVPIRIIPAALPEYIEFSTYLPSQYRQVTPGDQVSLLFTARKFPPTNATREMIINYNLVKENWRYELAQDLVLIADEVQFWKILILPNDTAPGTYLIETQVEFYGAKGTATNELEVYTQKEIEKLYAQTKFILLVFAAVVMLFIISHFRQHRKIHILKQHVDYYRKTLDVGRST